MHPSPGSAHATTDDDAAIPLKKTGLIQNIYSIDHVEDNKLMYDVRANGVSSFVVYNYR